jgi:outer membrane protein assembly factor BamB
LVISLVAIVVIVVWFLRGSEKPLSLRVPGTDQAPGSEVGGGGNAVLAGKLTPGEGLAASLPGTWNQFRGPNRDGISPDSPALSHSWQPGDPREIWGVDVGEGYAGAAIAKGRVYLMDYDREKRQDALRCLSLADGRELWRFSYPVSVKRNHGMTRTVPVVTDKIVVAMGPKCDVVCVEAEKGGLKWGMDLVRQFGTTVPPWYAGQCPLVDGNNVILAPAGRTTLLVAVDGDTGKVVWQTPNPHQWKMTHASVVPMEFGGARMYVYCANNGVVGVSAADGTILWETTDWKISIATVPSPLVLDGGRVFFSGGYNAGSLMMQVEAGGREIHNPKTFQTRAGGLRRNPAHTYSVREPHLWSKTGRQVRVPQSRRKDGLGERLGTAVRPRGLHACGRSDPRDERLRPSEDD